jgi:hypothetical protein
MSENFESTYESSIPKSKDYTVLGGSGSSDTISFAGSRLPGGMCDHSQDFWDYDGISLTGNPHSAPDTITFNLSMTEKKNHLWKYNEDKILKDVEDYVTTTYHGHYCGDSDGYADIQTIDLMAAKRLAAGFCQANILKYGSRYGDKDGRNKRDLMKVIHYAMLLLHFDGHYSRKDNGLSEFR